MKVQAQTLCPRCDYDLRGQVESWREECPLTGTCSECGLDFTWCEIFRAAFTIPDWSFEHAHELDQERSLEARRAGETAAPRRPAA